MPPDLSRQLADYAGRKRVSQASVVEAAVASFLSPDGSERMEAAFSRRLDRISRQMDKLDYHVEVGNEAVALFVRFWLGLTPSMPDGESGPAMAAGEQRFQRFIEALAQRVERGQRLANEITQNSS
nr:CopG family transcriptional regulator [Erythrobacter sp. SN021]